MQQKCGSEPFVYDDWKFSHLDQWVREHDLSKYSPEEFKPYRRWFYPTKHEARKKAKYASAFEKAWRHHYENNPHHWEYWDGKQAGHDYDPFFQWLCYVEMVLDWTAMSYKFGGTALEYYEGHKDEIKIAPDYTEFVERLLRQMATE